MDWPREQLAFAGEPRLQREGLVGWEQPASPLSAVVREQGVQRASVQRLQELERQFERQTAAGLTLADFLPAQDCWQCAGIRFLFWLPQAAIFRRPRDLPSPHATSRRWTGLLDRRA